MHCTNRKLSISTRNQIWNIPGLFLLIIKEKRKNRQPSNCYFLLLLFRRERKKVFHCQPFYVKGCWLTQVLSKIMGLTAWRGRKDNMKRENGEKSSLQSEPKLTWKQQKDLDYAQSIVWRWRWLKLGEQSMWGVRRVIGMFMQWLCLEATNPSGNAAAAVQIPTLEQKVEHGGRGVLPWCCLDLSLCPETQSCS